MDWKVETRAAYEKRKANGEFTMGHWVVMSGNVVVAHEKKAHIARAKMGAHDEPCLILEVGAESYPVMISAATGRKIERPIADGNGCLLL